MKYLGSLLLLLFWFQLAHSQTVAQPSASLHLTSASEDIILPNEIERLPWTVGTNMLSLINKGFRSSFFAKRMTQPEGKMPGAVRLRFGLNGNSTERNGLNITDDRYIDIFARVGYEWQIPIKKHQIFYGADIEFIYGRSLRSIPDILEISSFSIGPLGFVGYQYFLSSHVSFSTEISYNVYYHWRKAISSIPASDVGESTLGEFSYNAVRGSLNPFYVINFHYHF